MMMKTTLTLFLCLFLTFVDAAVEVVRSDDITLIEQYVNANTLVIFDLDDTLIRSKTTLGSPACFYRLRNKYIGKSDLPRDKVILAFSLFDKALQKHVEFTLVDPESKRMIEEFQKRGITVIGLTSRPHRLADVTATTLQKIGIKFGSTLPFSQKRIFTEKEAQYDRGVIYVGDGLKSIVLDTFIHHLPKKEKYTTIVFADDKEMYVRDLENYAKEKGYDYFGLYYTKEKEKQRSVDLSIAEAQLKHLISFSNQPSGTPLDQQTVRLFFNIVPKEGSVYLHGQIIPDIFLSH